MKSLLKRIMLLLGAVLLLGALTVTANAATVASGSFGDNVTWTLDDAGTLTFSGSGAMTELSAAADIPWADYRAFVKKGVISSGITDVGDYVFYECYNMTSVSIPSSVTKFGCLAFYDCDGLTGISIPGSVSSLDYGVFYDCDNLTSVTIPSGVTYIPSATFHSCDNLQSVSIPGSVTAIGDFAFVGCYALTGVSIPSAVTSIGDYAFRDCDSLTGISIPSSVSSIGKSAFYDCDNLTSVTIPYGVTTIAYATFYGCDNLTSATIPSTVTSIGDWAFGSTALTNVTIPGNVTTLGAYAFNNCDGLTSVTIPASVSSVGDFAFGYCDNLSSITFKGSAPTFVDSNDNGAPEAFYNVTATVIYRGDNSTWTSDMLQNYGGTLTWNPMYQCGDSVYAVLDSAGTLTISGTGSMWTFTTEPDVPWYDVRTTIKKGVIKSGVTTLGQSTFDGCTALASVTIPSSVTYIDTYAFWNCQSLTSVSIPGNVTGIGNAVFCNCDSLTSVKIPDSVTSMGGSVFSSCNNLKSVILSKNLTAISSSAFSECTSLTGITIPSSVTSIGSNAFYNCYALTSMTIPGSVTEIGTQAFTYCSNLSKVTFKGNAPSLGSNVFAYMTATVLYPSGNSTWTADVMQPYGGTITWESYMAELKAPTIAASNDEATGKPKISWSKVTGADKYDLYRATSKSGTYTKIGSTTGTSILNKSAATGKLYYYKVKAVSDEGIVSSYSNIVSRTCDLPRPEVTATNVASTGKVKLSWTAIDGAEQYELYRATSKTGTYSKIGSTSKNYITNTSAEAGKTYYYKVKAIHSDSAATSAYSAVVYRTCDLPQPVVTASNVASTGKVKLSWKAVEGATKYEIYRATSKDGTYTKLSTVTETSLTNTSTVAGKTYYYKVKAIHSSSAANSAYSEIVSRTCDLARPSVSVTNVASSGKVKLSWKAVEGATKYELYRATSKSGTYSKIGSTSKNYITNTSAEAGKTYYYKVKAIHSSSAANSAYSEIVSRTCDLAQPTVTATNVSSTGKIKLSWKAVEGATKYEVYRATSKSGTYSKMTTVTGTSVTHTGAVAGKGYYYKVRALCDNSAATSVYSSVVSRTCDLAQPSVTATNVSSTGKIKLSWKAVEGATKYEVYRATSKTGTYSKLTTVTGTSVTHTEAEAGEGYYYKVRALCDNSAATSVYSSIVSRTCDLARPKITTVTLNGHGKPIITWKKVDGATKYEIYRATSLNGTYVQIKSDEKITATAVVDSTASAGVTYYYKVRALCSNSAATSAYSEIQYIKSK